MIGNRYRQVCFLRVDKTGTSIFLIAFAMLLSACTTPATAPVSAREQATPDNRQRSSNSSGIAYRETAVSIAKIATPMVSLVEAHRMGSAQAKIGIAEFSDYQCPYCRRFHDQVFQRLKKEYVDTGVVQFIHKDLPLRSIHPQALPAALAASCAGVQQRFWPMHDALYVNSGKLSSSLYPQLGRELGLDEAKFTACLGDVSRHQVIMRDVSEARRLGITVTPSFAIGRIQGDALLVSSIAKGAASFDAFAQQIDELRKTMESDATPQIK